MTSTEIQAEDVAWDLEPLLPQPGESGVLALLDEADAYADTLSEQRGKVADFDVDALVTFMEQLAELNDALGRAGSYAALQFSTDTTDPARGALMQKVRERSTVIATKVLFFELEWAAVDDRRAEELVADERLAFAVHHLRAARRYRPHLLSEPEEVVLAEKDVTGSSAWQRLFEEQVSAITVSVDGDTMPLDAALGRFHSPDRELRRRTAEAVTEGLQPGLRTRAFVFNTLFADKSTDDRLRHFPSWIASRNLDNEASDESVQALVDAVQARYDIPQRWYALKARLLGLERIADYDRLASVDTKDSQISWSAARDLVLDAYGSFSSELADVAQRFFTESWIDAPVRPGKRPGAFCAYTVPSHHPYVMLNWTSRRRDVLTLAHELGHGAHAYLARPQGVFHQATPLTLAETASVFGETVTFGRLLSETNDPEERLSLLAANLEDQIATVFRQIAMNRFEDAAHTARREEGELSVERFGELWYDTQHAMLGDAVEITEGYRSWWSYIPHFVSTPGYVYAYAYGQLLALSVYARYEARGEAFVPQYLALLRAGGSMTPEALGRLVDVDLSDPGFWDAGLAIIDRRLAQTEEAARAAGRLQ
ncbi:MAG: oligoendopeptidase [Actinomycetota bacterium]|nr:oligoendopeptidase [Actinomycetota bacterium]